MTTIAMDPLGTFLAVAPDVYLGGKFVSDVIAPAAMFDPAVLLFAVPLVLAIDFGGSSEAAVVSLPATFALLLGALAALRWRRG
ncbi:hypothetical protein [Dinoroseobacter sp. S124A]|uniref:hypothetical protein n=1 Tax=Dinoroseobacter sp. S124A TaxID=3415128 RepID=UPI003C7DF3B6